VITGASTAAIGPTKLVPVQPDEEVAVSVYVTFVLTAGLAVTVAPVVGDTDAVGAQE
jgi:hypothetical protein